MKFDENVVIFYFGGIPIVGNLDNGSVIGLTSDGAAICRELLYRDVSKDEITAVDSLLHRHLISGSFFARDRSLGKLQSAYLHVTQRCNLDCQGCYSFDDQRNTLEDASLDQIIHAIQELAAGGIESLIISGGEPFLRDDIVDIVRFAKRDVGIKSVTVLSNGTVIHDYRLRRMVPDVDAISISMDGCSQNDTAYIRKKQRYNELVAAIKTVQSVGIPAHILPTMHARNINDLGKYLRIANKLNASIGFSLLSCVERNPDLRNLIPNDFQLKRLGKKILSESEEEDISIMNSPVGVSLSVKPSCEAGSKMVSVAADGTVYPCHMLHKQDFAMGNLFSESLETALQSDVARLFRTNTVENFTDCSSCNYKWLCGGGCRARSFTMCNNLFSKDAYCSLNKEFYSGLNERMQKATMRR